MNGLNKLDSFKLIVINLFQLKNLIWILLISKNKKLKWKKKKLNKMLPLQVLPPDNLNKVVKLPPLT